MQLRSWRVFKAPTSNKRFDLMSDRQSLPNGSVDVVQEVSVRLGGIKVGGFTGVDDGPPTNCQICVKVTGTHVVYGSHEAVNNNNNKQVNKQKSLKVNIQHNNQTLMDKTNNYVCSKYC